MDTKLHSAVRYGNADAVLEALKGGLDPNKIGLLKWSPVHEAAHNGEREILRLLLAYKGEVNAKDELHGNTPLHYAAREDNSACVTVLLKAGAQTDIQNDEGLTCMDLATALCKDIIQQFVNSQNTSSDWKDGKDDLNNNPKGSSMNGIRGQDKLDQIPSIPENAAIGHLHLSFEYHKTNLKVRVWQVSDLLLPPPQTSMIESIFVRSYLIPDSVKKTNRRTEEVRVEQKSSNPTVPLQSGIQHIFTPSSFRFDTPLLYMGVTSEIVAERSIQIEVCMTQKHTKKAFLMAMIHMPLRTAIRRPIREKYPLIPCMNYTIPNNMRIYSARDIILEGSSSSLNRSWSRSNSVYSSDSAVTARDVHLQDVEVEKFMRRFISVGMSDSDDEDDGVGSSIDIKSSLGKSVTSSTATVDVMSVSTDDDDTAGHLREIVNHKTEPTPSVSINMDGNAKPAPKKKIIPNELLNKELDSDSEDSDTETKTPTSKNSVIIAVEPEPKDTVVDITRLQGDVVLELDSQDKSQPESSSKTSPGGKKKIIPAELLISSPAGSNDQNSNKDPNDDSTCVYDDIESDNKNESPDDVLSEPRQISDASSPIKVVVDEVKTIDSNENGDDPEDDLSCEVKQMRPRTASIVSGSSSNPASRPETPIWDFYDFSLEDGAEAEEDAVEEDPEGAKDEASKALGTLQASLLRLSRGSKTLDTCRVSGPVLPTVALDFEMDENDGNVIVDDDDDEDENESSDRKIES